jgi:ubiquinone/menaquinone biosynthesis C-methylase UbiE
MLERVPNPVRRWLYAGGTRQDRLRDPDRVVAALEVSPGDRVADLGPGAGHFTIRLARAVAPGGVLYAADASRSTLEDLERGAAQRGLTTLRTVQLARDRLELPEPVDLLFVSATYHHLPDQVVYFAGARRYLRSGGRVAILESRREGLLARFLAMHATPPSRIGDEMSRAGYTLIRTHDVVYGYWFGIFSLAADERGPTA